MNSYAKWFGRVVWLGMIVNMPFVIGAFFFPYPFCELFGMTPPDQLFGSVARECLFIISIFYITAALDPFAIEQQR
jgi:hypothetical protein